MNSGRPPESLVTQTEAYMDSDMSLIMIMCDRIITRFSYHTQVNEPFPLCLTDSDSLLLFIEPLVIQISCCQITVNLNVKKYGNQVLHNTSENTGLQFREGTGIYELMNVRQCHHLS